MQMGDGFVIADSKGLRGRSGVCAGERNGQGVRPISSAKKQLNITDTILVVNGNQQYRTGNVRIEIFFTTKPSLIFGEEAAGGRIVVSGAIVRCGERRALWGALRHGAPTYCSPGVPG